MNSRSGLVRLFSLTKESAELQRKQLQAIDRLLTQDERKYLHFLANSVDDLNALEKQYLWKRVAEKAKENFEFSFPEEKKEEEKKEVEKK